MHHIRPRPLGPFVLVLVLVALALTSCGTHLELGAGALSPAPRATVVPYGLPSVAAIFGLHVLRMSEFAENRVAPFEGTSIAVDEVQRFYGAVLQLKPFPPNFDAYCNIDAGVSYQLDFLQHGAPAVQAVFAGGCPGVAVRGVNLQVLDVDGFCQLLGTALGVPASEVGVNGSESDTAPPGGPFAPAPPH